ncbi:HNH endonuclease signature motif containing protein [Candidatus Hamiltonella endosymbiont of Tuberolachnus salignus]|uniref:HNH endonuclease signature motif containing protein n=1 Tax=Candidatus Williamhamiltonella endosymbiont of Tuberolachnus salignus TaxID=3077954 RepID=UPI0030D55C4B
MRALWRRQDKRCLCCNQLITQETGWNIHHKVERVKGGGNELSNLELLHPNCHRQKHSRAAGYDRIVSQLIKGLSGMRGNLHVPFLGGGVTEMSRCYPSISDDGI